MSTEDDMRALRRTLDNIDRIRSCVDILPEPRDVPTPRPARPAFRVIEGGRTGQRNGQPPADPAAHRPL